MNNKIFIPPAAAAVLLGLLFVSLGDGLPALAQQETPEPKVVLTEIPDQGENPPDLPPPIDVYTDTLDTGEMVMQAPAGTDGLPPGIWTFETVDSAGTVGEYTSLELDTAGYPHISYYDRTNGDLKYAYQNTAGWHIETVDSVGDVGQYTSLELDTAGNPHISYLDITNRSVKYAYLNNSLWIIETIETGNVFHASLALDRYNRPHIAYFKSTSTTPRPTSGNLKYATRAGKYWSINYVESNIGGVCQFSMPPLQYEGSYWISIAVDAAGLPGISYVKSVQYSYGGVHLTNCRLKRAWRTGNSWSFTTVDTGIKSTLPYDQVGCYSSLAYDSSNRSHISYQNCSTRVLKLRSPTSGVVEASGTGFQTSLVLDQAGYDFISHYQTGAGDLRLSYSDSAGRYALAVDTVGDVGKYSSISLDSTGLPLISYLDATNRDLKLARYNTHGLFLMPQLQSRIGTRGESVAYQLTLYNQTEAPETLTLEFGSHAWQVGPLANPVGPIPVGGSLAVTVTVDVPADADWYSTDTVDVIARSQNDPTQTTNPARLTTQAYAPPRLSIEPAELNSQIWAGGQATQFLSIQNGNGITLTYNLFNFSLPPADIGLLMHMEDPISATAFVDSSQYNNILTCANDPAQCPIMEAPGVVGHGFEFTPSENVIHGVDAPNLNPTQAIAISVWINPSEWSDKFIVSKGTWGEAYNLYEQPGELRLRLWGVGEVSAPAPSLNQWHHVVGQYDGSRMQIWIDGSLRGEIGATGVISVTGNQLKIGALDSVEYLHTNHYVGSMDEMAILSRALTPTEIHYIYQTRSYDPITDLIASVNAEGEIPSNQIVNVPVVFDARWKQTGVYAQEIYLDTNDPAQGHVVIPVRMEVVEPPYRLFLPVLNQ